MIYLNDIEITPTIFPDNTSQVWKIDETPFAHGNNDFTILWVFENEAELIHIAQLSDLIWAKCDESDPTIKLHMPYLPYGRQDKEISNTSTFALLTFALIINQMNFHEVSSIDAHSDVAEEFINNFKNIEPTHYINHASRCLIADTGNLISFAYPDKGASERYNFVVDIIGHKVRDQETGYIKEYRIEGDPKGKDILIVDDLVDGGMTFILMAKELYKQGANSVHLYASHGIFSKGLKVLKDAGIKRIFTKEGEQYAKVDNINIINYLTNGVMHTFNSKSLEIKEK